MPYLPVVGAPPLRFQTAAPPGEVAAAPGAPPVSRLAPESRAAAAPSIAPVTAPAAAAPFPSPANPTPRTAAPAHPEAIPPPGAPSEKSAPPPILPDEARPSVRPDDFLPYFEIPGNAPGRAAAPMTGNAAAALPPSSATFTQPPK
jgi:hypothetical protein